MIVILKNLLREVLISFVNSILFYLFIIHHSHQNLDNILTKELTKSLCKKDQENLKLIKSKFVS